MVYREETIESFVFNSFNPPVTGEITDTSVNFTFPAGADLTNLYPTINSLDNKSKYTISANNIEYRLMNDFFPVKDLTMDLSSSSVWDLRIEGWELGFLKNMKIYINTN